MCIFLFNYLTYYFSFCTNNMFVITQTYTLQDGRRIDGDLVRDFVGRYDSDGKKRKKKAGDDSMITILFATNAPIHSSLSPRSNNRYIFLARLRALVPNWMKEQDGVYSYKSRKKIDKYLSERLGQEGKRLRTESKRKALTRRGERVFEPRIQVGNGEGSVSYKYKPFNSYVPVPQFEEFKMMSEYGKILLS